MTDLEKALQAGAEDITDYDRAVRGGAVEVPSGTPNMMRQPKSFTASDEEIGIGSSPPVQQEAPPPITAPIARIKRGWDEMTGGDPNPFNLTRPLEDLRQANEAFFQKHGRYPRDPMEVDPIAQSVALTAVLGPFGRMAAAGLAPRIGALPAGAAVGAGEAALGAKSSGGDVGEAAKFGGLFGAIGAAASRRPSSTAAAANDAQLVKDVKRGSTKAPKNMADDVDLRADQLIDSTREAPDVRKALVTKSRSNPAAAEATAQKTLDADVAANNSVYDAIEQHHGGFDLNLVTDRLATLEARYHQQGNMVHSEAVGRVLDKLNKQYGGNAGGTLTAEQLRNIRNDLGDVAFPGMAKEARPSAAKAALRDVYDEFNAAIEDVASLTPGVDVAALRARNQRISSLSPAQKALGERAALEADRELSLYGSAKDKFKKAVTGANRRLRYQREQTGGGGGDNQMLMGAPAYGPMDDENQAARAAKFLLGGP